MNNPYYRRPQSKHFHTKIALISTLFSVFILFLLTVGFSEWNTETTLQDFHYQQQPKLQFVRQLEQDEEDVSDATTSGDYAKLRCDNIFANTPSPSEDESNPSKRCKYAQTCEGDGVLLPFVFCSRSIAAWLVILSPILFLGLALLFRLLGSTAEEYFSPSLEFFSFKLGLPPRFAGVTLLALGNGAADVSSTMNAISSDTKNGYQLSLGALTGAAMFITTVVAGAVVLANGGLKCRGALVRDVLALAITCVVVALNLEEGKVTQRTESLFISMYIIFVAIVLLADIYHRAIMLPRIQNQAEMVEQKRQLEAETLASMRAGDALCAAASREGNQSHSDSMTGNRLNENDDRTHSTAPSPLQVEKNPVGNRALNAVLTALSNYEEEENELQANSGRFVSGHSPNGWGIESNVEGTHAWDRPVVLRGADGILAKHGHHHPQNNEEDIHDSSPYHVMEDMDLADQLCVENGSRGFPAHNWIGAWHDGKQELVVHFREYWRDIVDDEESGKLEKFLLICEFPVTLCRKLTVSIPCEGSYCRTLVALSFALSPLWLGIYLLGRINVWSWQLAVYVTFSFIVGLLILRYAPGGDGNMASMFAVPIALYGFMIAATWIDFFAGKLVSLLGFLGIVLRIPNYIMGLTVLAWGNSMADLSANVTMARKGLANMAITACFAGPVFNILIGLGAGFSVLRNSTKLDTNYVSLTPSITTGFVFCFVNCGLVLVAGLAVNKGSIPAGYGYVAITLYAAYVVTSLLLLFLL